ncbi:MAG: bifunctional UDP-N-acetylglucosamine diphosphorylase/glucosamine-1-phosphate N-acetyltransferase GlmU [Hyphomicrobiaceae bacterium]
MSERSLLIVALAAGKGTRMKSAVPKVLHQVGGRSLLGHVLSAASAAGADKLAVVVGPGMEAVGVEAGRFVPGAATFVQERQLGTGDAVLAARAAIESHRGDVLVVLGDTPFLTTETLVKARRALAGDAGIAVVGFEARDPTGYGRLLQDGDGSILAIREEKEATDAERSIRLCNSGVIGFRSERMFEILSAIRNDNAKGEYYLTDAIEIGRSKGVRAVAVLGDETEMLGINDRAQLAAAERIFQDRRRADFMADGVTMIAPETVYVAYDTVIGRDVVIEPFVVLGPGVSIADNVHVKSFTYLVGKDAKSDKGIVLGDESEIGPFTRMRPGTTVGEGAHVGNFVELKNSTLGPGAKASHLAYLGDGRVGAKANIGAGTIFCNYDGYNKHVTEIGEGAFVGSNTSLVAPVRIGAGAYVGSGSVITRDVGPDALALERAKQEERPDWARKFRQVMARRKSAKS